MYSIFRFTCNIIVHLVFKIQVEGAEKFPKDGPVIVYSNHNNNWDPFIIACHVKRPVHFMAKAELFKNPVLAFFLRQINAFPVNRGTADRKAIKKALQVLEENKVLGIFPEGTRNDSGHLLDPEPGIALLTVKSNDTTLVPLAIKGNYKPFSRIDLIFGEPNRPTIGEEKYNSQKLKELSIEIFSEVHRLMFL